MGLWRTIFNFWQRHEHRIGVGALAMGFLFDLWIAKRPDSVANNLLLLAYIFIAGAFIVILNLRERRKKDDAEPLFLLLVLQFCFGGLASNLLVLYGHSGTLAGSALFVALLVCVVFGNEYFRSRYSLLRFNIGVYYFLMLSYALVAVPIFITHSIGTLAFLLSGLVSLVAIGLFLALLFVAVFRGRDTQKLKEVTLIIGAIFCIYNALYFLNVIPPVPLSLKNIGIYHSVLKLQGGGYIALYEQAPWWEFWRDTSGTYVNTTGTASCFSAVFAPADLETPIYHTWEYKNASGEWEVRSRVSFPLSGGRADGYRGYTVKAALQQGEWRCDVETASGALIGRTSFTVVGPTHTPVLSQTTL
jgi:hypothetical protein